MLIIYFVGKELVILLNCQSGNGHGDAGAVQSSQSDKS